MPKYNCSDSKRVLLMKNQPKTRQLRQFLNTILNSIIFCLIRNSLEYIKRILSQHIQQNLNQMFLFRTSNLLILLFLLVTVARADYFAGLNLDPCLTKNATNAINQLKRTLESNFACVFNSFTFFFKMLFPFSNDNNPLSYTEPVAKNPLYCLFAGCLGNQLYNQFNIVGSYLQQIKTALKAYNNIVIGTSNTIVGNNNFVVASNVTVVGSNDWIFTSDYTSNDIEDGVLILGNFLVEKSDLNKIKMNPLAEIRCIKTQDMVSRSNFWLGSVNKNAKVVF